MQTYPNPYDWMLS